MSTATTTANSLRVSPNCGLPTPLVRVREVRLSDDQACLLVDPKSPERFVPLPEEHYLRGLADLDLTDPEAIASFVATWGLPESENQESPRVDAVTAALAWIRDLTDAWDHLTGGMSFEEMLHGWERAPSTRPVDSAEAASVLQDLGEALTDFSPRLSASEPPLYRTSLSGALAAQLFNHIAEGKGYLRCADPKCGRRFVRHLNRKGVPGPEKKTVRFCSQQCQDRYFNEEFRRRQRVAKLRDERLTLSEIAERMRASEQDVTRWLDSLEQLG